jgi:hypothetical protein
VSDEERRQVELECLREAKLALLGLSPEDPVEVHKMDLVGRHPDTEIVVTGRRTYEGGKAWRVRFPIWDNGTGGVINGEPDPRFIGTLVMVEVLEA